MNLYYVAAIWLALALLASLISIRVAIPVALVEIVLGALAGNIPGIKEHVVQTQYTTFLASIGSVVLTFLAGAEIDPVSLRKHWKASLSIGFVSFLLPLLGAFTFCRVALGWRFHAAEVGGVALSTTSVAVVYAVMVETGFNRTEFGKGILGACFVNDLGTVIVLGLLFSPFTYKTVVFIAATVLVLVLLPHLTGWLTRLYAYRTAAIRTKWVMFILFGLGALAYWSGSESVPPLMW